MKAAILLLVLAAEQGLICAGREPFTTLPSAELMARLMPSFNGTIQGPCLEIIVNKICYGKSLYTDNMTNITNSTEFKCEGPQCYVTALESRFCRLQSFEQRRARTMSHFRSGNNNVHAPCTRFVNETVYTTIRKKVGWRCENQLRCLCADCRPSPRLRHHEDRTKYLSPSMRLILSHLRRSHVSMARKEEVLENLLLDEFTNLIIPDEGSNEVRSYRVNSTLRNYPVTSKRTKYGRA